MHMSFAKEQPSRVAEIGIRQFQLCLFPLDLGNDLLLAGFQLGRLHVIAGLQYGGLVFFFGLSRRRSTYSPIRSQRFWTRAAGYSSRRPENDASAAAH